MLKQFSLLFSPTLVGEYNVNKEGEILFSRVCCDRTRGNGFKVKEGRFRLDIRRFVGVFCVIGTGYPERQ